MKYSLPYTPKIGEYIDNLTTSSVNQISDLYFSDSAFNPSARYFPEADMISTWKELTDIKDSHGIDMHYIMNSSVWKNDVYTTGKQQVIDNIHEVYNRGCRMLTINNMFLIRDVEFRESLPQDLMIKISVNNKISSLEEVEFLYNYNAISHVILDRSINRNFDELERIHNWTKPKGITLTLLAQEGCLTKCPWKSTCDNMIATFSDYDIHEVNDLKAHHSSHFCTTHYAHHPADHLKSPWIPPTAVGIYEDYVDYIKLAGRNNPIAELATVIDSYLNKTGTISLNNILPVQQNNNLTSSNVCDLEVHGYSSKVYNCHNKCSQCDFCDRVYDKLSHED